MELDGLQELAAERQRREDFFEKAFDPTYIEKGKRAQIGEIREWSDGKYRRTATGWEYIKGSDPKLAKKSEEKITQPKKEEVTKKPEPKVDLQKYVRSGLSKHRNVIGNRYISYNDAIEFFDTERNWGFNIDTNIKNPTHRRGMGEVEYEKEWKKVHSAAVNLTKPLVEDIKSLLKDRVDNLDVEVSVEDEAEGDGSYWVMLYVRGKKKD